MRKTLCFILISAMMFSMLSLSSSAADVSWSFSAEEGVLTFSGNGKMTDWEKPEDAPWNYLSDKVKSVVVEQGITHIGDNSFYMFSSLYDVTLPETLNDIGAHAFERCWDLEFIDMPNSVTEIGNYAFSDCWKLKRVAIGLNTSKLWRIGDGAFSLCTSLDGMNIPKNVTYIGDAAFRSCTFFKNIKLPDKLLHIGEQAFEACAALTEIDIPWQITEIPDFAFFDCTSLKKVTFGKYIKKIGRETFMWCDKLDVLVFPDGISEMGENAFGYYYVNGKYIPYRNAVISSPGKDAAEAYASENGLRFLKYDMNYQCPYPCPVCGKCTGKCKYYSCLDNCEGHSFPVTGTCGDGVSWSLSNRGDLKISGTGVMYDFDFCGAPWKEYSRFISSVVVDGKVESIGSHAFEGFTSLKTVTLSGSVKEIRSKAFYGCTSLEDISFGGGLGIIGTYAFGRCVKLKSADMSGSGSLIEISRSAFLECTALELVSLPHSIETVGAYAFEGCTLLRHISVPASLVSIGARAMGFEFTPDRAFVKTEGFYISGDASSDALRYCQTYGINFERTDTHACSDKCVKCGRCTNFSCRYPECADKCDGICSLEWTCPYNDVEADDWFFDSIKYVTVKGLFNGKGEGVFAPQETVTRAQAATALWRLSGKCEPTGKSPFEDLSDDWYRMAVDWAYEAGIVNGISENTFDPGGKLTREQLAVMLMRYKRFTDGGYIMRVEDLSYFPDSADVSPYAEKAMSWAYADRLITGINIDGVDYLSPKSSATRAQLATIFMRMIRYR